MSRSRLLAAALTGGLVAGDVYRTSTGNLMIVS